MAFEQQAVLELWSSSTEHLLGVTRSLCIFLLCHDYKDCFFSAPFFTSLLKEL